MGGDVSTHLILRLNQKIFPFLNTNDPALDTHKRLETLCRDWFVIDLVTMVLGTLHISKTSGKLIVIKVNELLQYFCSSRC